MRKATLLLAAVAAALLAVPGTARAAQCGLPDAAPLWIDFGDPQAEFAQALFAQPGLVVATSKPAWAATLRAAGTHTVFWDMHLKKRVGTPAAPADPATVPDAANRLFDFAAAASGCATPLIALNELFGANLPRPWTITNDQYRANVLLFLKALSGRGARPFLLVAKRPPAVRGAGWWWRAVARVADIVRQVYVAAPRVAERTRPQGRAYLRGVMRRSLEDYTRLGISPTRLGLMLGFHTTPRTGGRDGLSPRDAWFEVVELQTRTARQTAAAYGISTVWSWGWGVWSAAEADPDKAGAACIYLSTRHTRLCDAAPYRTPALEVAPLHGVRAGVTCHTAWRLRPMC